MIETFALWLIEKKVSARIAKPLAWIIAIVGGLLLLVGILGGAYALIHHDGETAGAAKANTKTEGAHTAAVADARADEHTAQVTTDRIAERTVRTDAATDAYVRSTIEELRNELDQARAAPGTAAPAPAPVGVLAASLNASIDRANRAADIADAAR